MTLYICVIIIYNIGIGLTSTPTGVFFSLIVFSLIISTLDGTSSGESNIAAIAASIIVPSS